MTASPKIGCLTVQQQGGRTLRFLSLMFILILTLLKWPPMCYLGPMVGIVTAKLHLKISQFCAALLIGRPFTPGWTWLRLFQNHVSLYNNSEFSLSSKQHLISVLIKLYNWLTLLRYAQDCVLSNEIAGKKELINKV